MADVDIIAKDPQYHLSQLTNGESTSDQGASVYDTVEVEELHNGSAEDIAGEFHDDGMGVTEIETDTGLQLNGLPPGPHLRYPPMTLTLPPRRHSTSIQPVAVVETGKSKMKTRPRHKRGRPRNDEVRAPPPPGPIIRPFQWKWLLMYEWLRYDPDRKYMHCHFCQENKKKNAFGKSEGTNNFRKSNCEEHQRCNDHKRAQEAFETKNHIFQRDNTTPEDPMMRNVTAVRGPDGSVRYQGNASLTSSGAPAVCHALQLNSNLQFHAKKAHMLLAGFLSQKNLPASLSKDLLEIMPFMFPDSKIAAEIANLKLP